MKNIKRRLAAIMFTDMVGYSALMQKDEHLAKRLRDRHREVFVRNTTAYGGEILQYYGDGTLSIYPSASAAVECGLKIQQELQEPPTVSLRVGIHTGDINYGEEDIYGDGVNIASRIETLCIPGGIFISGKVQDDIKNLPTIKTRSLGPFKLKNIAKEIEIFAITNEGIKAPPMGNYQKIGSYGQMPPLGKMAATPHTPRTQQVVSGNKRKFVAGLLAFFLGIFGAHRFYLGQRHLGLLYVGATLTGMFLIKALSALIPIVAIISFVDAVIFLSMSKMDFNLKYNTVEVPQTHVETQQHEEVKYKTKPEAPPQKNVADEEFDKCWKKALEEYGEYDYEGAIKALEQAIAIKSNDPEAHFLLARCYSVNEKTGPALTHLELAVNHGLDEKERILTQNDLAFLRMQPQFEAFIKNNYRLLKELPEPTEDLFLSKKMESPDLLEQLQKLVKLREEGQLTEMEYQTLVKKLNG